MNKFFVLIGAVLTLAVPNFVNADECCESREGYYAGAFAGANWVKKEHGIDFQTGYRNDLSVGYRWCNGLRLEAEMGYHKNRLKHIHLLSEDELVDVSLHGFTRTYSLMANVVYEFPITCMPVQPFVGVGLGYGWNKIRISDGESSAHAKKNQMDYQLLAGVTYPMGNIDLDLKYCYQKPTRHLDNHSVGLGARYNF